MSDLEAILKNLCGEISEICLIQDIFDFKKYPKNYYLPKNPLEAKK